jgi:prolipoprotein diacylglyceryltransferase
VHQPGSSPWASLAQALKFNEGGLVVYGAVIGGLAAALVFCRRHRLNIWTVGDLVAPGMVLGLALGRIGCLFNGCCHGGPCSDEAFAVTFPRGTHPYMEQLESGQLMGWELEGAAPNIRIRTVRPDSPAGQRGIQPGDRLVRTPGANDLLLAGKSGDPNRQLLVVEKPGGTIVTWTAQQLPPRSLPTRPAQIYSSINALLLWRIVRADADDLPDHPLPVGAGPHRRARPLGHGADHFPMDQHRPVVLFGGDVVSDLAPPPDGGRPGVRRLIPGTDDVWMDELADLVGGAGGRVAFGRGGDGDEPPRAAAAKPRSVLVCDLHPGVLRDHLQRDAGRLRTGAPQRGRPLIKQMTMVNNVDPVMNPSHDQDF